jgi:hypothetical protein
VTAPAHRLPNCPLESTKQRELGFRALRAHEAAEIELALG